MRKATGQRRDIQRYIYLCCPALYAGQIVRRAQQRKLIGSSELRARRMVEVYGLLYSPMTIDNMNFVRHLTEK